MTEQEKNAKEKFMRLILADLFSDNEIKSR